MPPGFRTQETEHRFFFLDWEPGYRFCLDWEPGYEEGNGLGTPLTPTIEVGLYFT